MTYWLTDWPSVAMWLWLWQHKKKQKSWHRTNIWPWVPAGLDAKNDRAGCLPAVSYCSALLCGSGIYKRQTRPLVRENAPQKQYRNSQTVINIWSLAQDGARQQDLLTDRQFECDFYFGVTESREWEYNGEPRGTTESTRMRTEFSCR
jgi:hypothetical protein